MTVVRLWAQKHPKCFDPENDTLLLDFELQKTEASELLRDYFEYWEDDEYNRMVIEVVGGAFPHFDCWWDENSYTKEQLEDFSRSSDPDDVLIWKSCSLVTSLEKNLAESNGELFMEVE